DPVALTREIADDVARGARSLWLCFDAQVRSGKAGAEPSREPAERGVPCVSAEQLAALLESVPLERLTLSLDAGANALAIAACYAHALQARGLPLERARVWFNADPLAALARDGALPYTLDATRTQLVQLASWATR